MRLYGLVVLLAWLSVLPAHAQEPPAVIESFGPEGFVKNVRQVRARFSEAMTPLGDPRDRVSPFLIEAPVAGSGKWEDETHWVYDFEKDLPGGVRATFTVRPGLMTLAGRPVEGGRILDADSRITYGSVIIDSDVRPLLDGFFMPKPTGA